jgi:hypothetical protein
MSIDTTARKELQELKVKMLALQSRLVALREECNMIQITLAELADRVVELDTPMVFFNLDE